MKRIFFVILMSILFCFSSCDVNNYIYDLDGTSTATKDKSNAIEFTVDEWQNGGTYAKAKKSSITTRAGIDFEKGNTILKTQGFGVNSDKIPFFNAHVTWNGEKWVYSPVRYWSDNALTFYAWAPYDINPDDNGIISYTTPMNENVEITDVIGACIQNVDPNTTVKLVFKHLVAKININAFLKGNLEDNTKLILDSVNISSTDIPTFGKLALNTYSYQWTNIVKDNYSVNINDNTDKKGYTLTNKEVSTNSTKITNSSLYIIPAYGTNVSITVKYHLEYTVNGNVVKDTQKTGTLTKNVGFELGKRYNLNLVFTKTNSIQFTDTNVTVEDWVDGGNTDFEF
jgi:hypothetical protein